MRKTLNLLVTWTDSDECIALRTLVQHPARVDLGLAMATTKETKCVDEWRLHGKRRTGPRMVTARTGSPTEISRVQASYVVDCDGANSTV